MKPAGYRTSKQNKQERDKRWIRQRQSKNCWKAIRSISQVKKEQEISLPGSV
jgi:hypothetical protein